MPLRAPAFDFAPLDSLLDSRYAAGEPGGAVIIACGDSVVYERYSGMARIEDSVQVSADTRFCIASVSKQFTVMALLQQAMKWTGPMPLLDTPVPELFGFDGPAWSGVTVRHLASHSSGIPDERPHDDLQWCIYADEDDAISYMPHVARRKFAPGEYYDYLNPSFVLIGRLIENLSGMPYSDYMARHVFGPAQMHATYCFDRYSDPQHQAHAYLPGGAGEWRQFDYGEETFFATVPDCCIYTTARDLLKWENALRDSAIVPATWRSLAYTPHVKVSDSPFCSYQRRTDTWYGLGFFIEHPAGKPVKIFHTGDNGGFQAYLAKYPEEDIKIIILENRNDRSRSLLTSVIDRIIGTR